MTETEAQDALIRDIETKIDPYKLSKRDKLNLSSLISEYGMEQIKDAMDISYRHYIKIDKDGNPTAQSVMKFLEKIGGIAYNHSLSPIEQTLIHINNKGKTKFSFWRPEDATKLLNNYVKTLKENQWTEENILNHLEDTVMEVVTNSSNWLEFKNKIEKWTKELSPIPIEEQEESFLVNGTLTIQKKYNIIKQIGSGSFGITYLALDLRLNKQFVVKEFACEMLKEEDNRKFFHKFFNEIQFLFDLHHENIVNIYDYIMDDVKHIGYYIMEFIDGKNIFDYLKDQPDHLNSLFLQTLHVFRYLETKKICHRDIRINNLLVTNEGILKLIDFGFVKSINESTSVHSATQLIIYPYDYPKELRNKRPRYDNKTELYFIGQLFLDLMNQLQIKEFKYSKLLKKMSEYDAKKRYSSFAAILTEVEKMQ